MDIDDSSSERIHDTVLSNDEVSYNDATGKYTIRVKVPDSKSEALKDKPAATTIFNLSETGGSTYIVESAFNPHTVKTILTTLKRLL